MNRFLIAAVLAAAAGANVGGQPGAAAPRWEYGTLTETVPGDLVWTAGDGSVSAPDWVGLAGVLKARMPPEVKKTVRDGARVAVLDRIGAGGWELVSHTAVAPARGELVGLYTFKRRLP